MSVQEYIITAYPDIMDLFVINPSIDKKNLFMAWSIAIFQMSNQSNSIQWI